MKNMNTIAITIVMILALLISPVTTKYGEDRPIGYIELSPCSLLIIDEEIIGNITEDCNIITIFVGNGTEYVHDDVVYNYDNVFIF